MNVAIVQAHLEWENVPENLKLFNKRIAAIEGANVIVLPEMFASGFTMKGKERVTPFYEAIYQCMQEWVCVLVVLFFVLFVFFVVFFWFFLVFFLFCFGFCFFFFLRWSLIYSIALARVQ